MTGEALTLRTDRLKNLLAARGLKPPAAARAAGVAEPTFYRMLRRGYVKGANLKRLATFFGVSTDYLLGLSDNPSPVDSVVKADPDMAALLNEYSAIKGLPDDIRTVYLDLKRQILDLALKAVR